MKESNYAEIKLHFFLIQIHIFSEIFTEIPCESEDLTLKISSKEALAPSLEANFHLIIEDSQKSF